MAIMNQAIKKMWINTLRDPTFMRIVQDIDIMDALEILAHLYSSANGNEHELYDEVGLLSWRVLEWSGLPRDVMINIDNLQWIGREDEGGIPWSNEQIASYLERDVHL